MGISDNAVCGDDLAGLGRAGLLQDCADVVCGWVELYRADGIKQAQARAARALRLSPRRVRSWWERTVTRPDGFELMLIIEARERLRTARMEFCRAELARIEAEEEARRAKRPRPSDRVLRDVGAAD